MSGLLVLLKENIFPAAGLLPSQIQIVATKLYKGPFSLLHPYQIMISHFGRPFPACPPIY